MARGSVFRKNGGWAFRVDAGFHAETGKRRQLLRQGFGTKRAAEEALAEAVGAATTARGYEQSIGRLRRCLGNYQLQALTSMQVQRCYTDLLESGGHGGGPLAPKTVRHAHVALRKALAEAERMGLSPATRQRQHARRPVRAPR